MKRPPNILIFMADQMVADVVRPDHPCHMPHARRLAAEGVRFERAFCTAPHCSPSRASFFTGQMPSRHGVWNNVANRCALSRDLRPGIPTLGERLREAGYSLGFAGKWHVSDLRGPADFGWEEFLLTDGKGQWERSRIALYEQGLGQPLEEPLPAGTIRRPGWGDSVFYGPADDSAFQGPGGEGCIAAGATAIHTLARRAQPWCVFVSCTPPHDPCRAPRRLLRQYDGLAVRLPASYADPLVDKPRVYQRMRRQYWDQLGPHGMREAIRHYWALCSLVDEWLGRLLEALEATGQAADTLVVFTSDHGDYAGAHGLWCKGVPAFREAYAIPLVMRWPAGLVAPGRSVQALVSIADLLPTFVELAGGPVPEVYGRSLAPFLRHEPPEAWREALVMQLNGVELYYTQRIVMTERWKYVYNGFDFDELYDLQNDPEEMVNLAFPGRYGPSAGAPAGPFVPWPSLSPELEAVRQDLHARLWQFARQEEDHFLYTPYLTTALAAYGPGHGRPSA